MARWLIKVAGNHADLEELPYWFPSGSSFAFVEGADVFVASDLFLPSAPASHVYETAQLLLSEWHASISLLWSSFIPPIIENVIFETDDGDRKVHHFLKGANCGSRSKSRATLSDSSGPTRAQQFVELAKRYPLISEILSLWMLPHRTWPRLYRILEEIERHLGDKADNAGICSSIERSRFTASANNSLVAGADSRHAGGKYRAPQNPMSLHEAENFIRKLMITCLTKG